MNVCFGLGNDGGSGWRIAPVDDLNKTVVLQDDISEFLL